MLKDEYYKNDLLKLKENKLAGAKEDFGGIRMKRFIISLHNLITI